MSILKQKLESGFESILIGDLPRRSCLGVVLEEIPLDTAIIDGQSNSGVLRIRKVHNSSAAAKAGIQQGDLVVSVGGIRTRTVSELIQMMRTLDPGTATELIVVRDGRLLKPVVSLAPTPLEVNPGVRTIYLNIDSNGIRLRTIAMLPEGARTCPTVLLLQGLKCESIDHPFSNRNMYRRFVSTLAENGIASIRLERRGTGDSEGADTRDLDFYTELDDYIAFTHQACEWDIVEKNNVCIFGYSMGGVFAPIVERECSIRALVTYGTIGMPWNRYILDTTRRQRLLVGANEESVNVEMERLAVSLDLLNVKKIHPQDIHREHPGLLDFDGEYMYSRRFSFFVQLSEIDILGQWQETCVPTLVLSGDADFVASPENQRAIFHSLPNCREEHGSKFVQVQADHWFRRTNTMEQSFRNEINANFNYEITKVLAEWLKSVCRQMIRTHP